MKKKEISTLPLTMCVQVTHSKGKPCIVLRKTFTDMEEIKKIVRAAWNDEGLIFVPLFSDKVSGLSSLVRNGIVYKDEKGQYQFTI